MDIDKLIPEGWWMARDEDGTWRGHEAKPEVCKYGWHSTGASITLSGIAAAVEGCQNWPFEKSLMHRPVSTSKEQDKNNDHVNIQILKASCGCIILKVNGSPDGYIIQDCRAEDNEYGFYNSDLSKHLGTKKIELLPEPRTRGILANMDKLIRDGYKFRELKRILS